MITPGPWLFRSKSDDVYTAPQEGTAYSYGEFLFGFKDEGVPNDADLALILAAPSIYEASKALADAVRDETEALRNFKGADGAGMTDCTIAQSRVTDCLVRLDEVLFQAEGHT